MKKILGLGNALTDILLQVTDKDLKKLTLPKGSMNLIDWETAKAIQSSFLHVRKSMVAGGSAANTISAIASLGGNAALIGKIGKDEIGDFYREDLIKNGARPLLLTSDMMSGFCTVFITPDGERTFGTYLGAAADLKPEDITKDAFKSYDIFHIEGYMVQNHSLIERALKIAKDSNMLVSIDLASYNVVNENLDFLHRLIKEYVDIVFANEDESFAYTGKEPQESLAEISKECEIAIVKVGKRGSYVKKGENKIHVDAISSRCIDSTGAGDLYAAGFLHGISKGLDITRCAEIGTLAAGRVVEVVGTKLTDETWEEVRRLSALYRGVMD